MKKRLLLMNNRSDSRQRGNAMTEFVIVIPVLILLIFGTIQIGLIYSAKVTLNYATFQSARLGATNNATYSALRRGLIRGLAPLYTTSSDLDGIKTDIALGINSNAQRRDAKSEVDSYTKIIRLSPTTDAFASYSDNTNVDGTVQIPNDNLMFRPSNDSFDGANLQDANLLKIRVQYCYKLMVPIVNRIIASLSQLNDNANVGDSRFADRNRGVANDAASRYDHLASYDDLCGGRDGASDRSSGSTGFMMFSEAIVRMQSPAYEDDDGEEFGQLMCDGTHMSCP
jgi:Flp pilus assembly protein TadG